MELSNYFAPENNLGYAIRTFFREFIGLDLNTPTQRALPANEFISEKSEIIQDIHSLYFAGQLTPNTFEEEIFSETFEDIEKSLEEEKYKTILVFGIDLKNGTPSKTILKQITRKLNVRSKGAPVVVIFRSGQWLSFANIERQKYKQNWREGEKPGMVSLLKDVCVEKPHAAHKRILKSLTLQAMAEYDRKERIATFDHLHKGWQRVFSTSILNEEFYKDYQSLSVQIIRAIYPTQVANKLKAHQGALNLLNRLMFVYFIQKKGWLMGDPEFIYHFWNDYLNQKEAEQKDCADFHEKWLNKLFFTAFNGKAYQDKDVFRIFPEKYKEAILEFPFLNGGLFTKTDEDDFLLNDNLFFDVFRFFQSYIFTISEDTADEINLEINPELLGKMYEGMINATDLDDVDAENGIVYTERPEINFMTRRSFVEVFHKKLPEDKYSREFLYHFCFDKPDAKLELLRKYKVNAEEIRQVILSITALDPACGSGSMLIGVIQLQLELLKCLYEYQNSGKSLSHREEFLLKKQIISESIYGVDIKEWAVRIAELRFWLYMIADAEFTTEELVKEPLLPNLDFKLRQGDSLIQEIGSLDFSLKGLFKGKKRNAGATRKLNEFIKKKKEFIANNVQSKTSFKKLKEEELFVFRTFIDELLFENTQRIKQMKKGDGQQKIFDEPKTNNIFQGQIDTLKKENQQLKKVKESIKDKGRLPFSYDIDFMEIFIASEDPGFDLVIGNPPYVRQENILPAHDAMALERLMLQENNEERVQVSRTFKEKLSSKVFSTYPFLNSVAKVDVIDDKGNSVFTPSGKKKQKNIEIYGKKVSGKSDLYVYFQLLCPYYLNSKGIFCFIISNSWLDAQFGGFVQHFLLKHTDLYSIYDCNVRSFVAKVNTVIYFHSALKNTNLMANKYLTLLPEDRDVKFVMNNADYTDTAYAPLLLEQERCHKNTFKEFYRVIVKQQHELWLETYDEETYSYLPNKWGGKYFRAPSIYFEVLDNTKCKKELVNNLVVYTQRNTLENTISIVKTREPNGNLPYLYSSKLLSNIYHRPNEIQGWIDVKNSRFKEKKLSYKIPDLISNRFIGERIFFVEGDNYLVGDTFFVAEFKNKKLKEYYLGCLNSTLSILSVLVTGRANMGDGVLLFYGPEFKNLPVFLPDQIEEVVKCYKKIKTREVLTIFEELGINREQPVRSQIPNPKEDRFKLDEIFFKELNLTNEEINEVYWATAELAKSRIDRAETR